MSDARVTRDNINSNRAPRAPYTMSQEKVKIDHIQLMSICVI